MGTLRKLRKGIGSADTQPAILFLPESDKWDANKHDTIVIRDQEIYNRTLAAARAAVGRGRRGVSVTKSQDQN